MKGHMTHRSYRVAARDGAKLATDVYLPSRFEQAGTAVPVLLERTPYSRSNSRLVALAQEAAARGYAFVLQDVRGRGESEGRFGMLFNEPDEGSDGDDTFRWILMQDWCNGTIASVGGSFSATNQQAAAVRRPPGLRAQILRDAGNNYYRRMLRYHGAANQGVILPWVLDQAISSPEAMSDASAREALVQMRARMSAWLPQLPLRRGVSPLARIPLYEDLYFMLMETSDDVAPWDNPAARLEGRWDDYPRDVAVLLISGWFGHHCAANLEKFREMSARLERPVNLIVGPWLHAADMLEASVAGDCDFGPTASIGRSNDVWLDWLDQRLCPELETRSTEPAIRYFVMGIGDGHRTAEGRIFHGGAWRESDQWPPAHLRDATLYLRAGGALSASSPIASEASASDYPFDVNDPCPGIGSSNLQVPDAPDFVLPGPREQRCRAEMAACGGRTDLLDSRRDVLVFETSPLVTPLEIVGEVTLNAWVRTTASDADFVVRLVDVYPSSDEYPDGFPLAISDGILRLRYRNSKKYAEAVEPEAVYEVSIELSPIANMFKAGHRVRVTVTSSAWPQYDLNRANAEEDGGASPVWQTVFHEPSRPSRLIFACPAGTSLPD